LLGEVRALLGAEELVGQLEDRGLVGFRVPADLGDIVGRQLGSRRPHGVDEFVDAGVVLQGRIDGLGAAVPRDTHGGEQDGVLDDAVLVEQVAQPIALGGIRDVRGDQGHDLGEVGSKEGDDVRHGRLRWGR
jgi:hypothetical protein